MLVQNLLKRYAVLVTELKTNVFYRTRTRLTVFFATAITILLILSSTFIYIIYSQQISSNQQGNFTNNYTQEIYSKAQIEKLGNSIIIIDAVAILASIGAGWWLAGRTLRPIEQMLKSQKKFVANASHDLRTPLTVMRTGIELAMQRHKPKNPLYQILVDNLEEVAYMEQLTNELLREARTESLGINKRLLPCNLALLTQSVLDNLSPYANSHNIKLTFTNRCTTCDILGAHNDIRRALTNIIKNAIDYSKPGQAVKVNMTINRNFLIWECTDTGIGIAPADLPHIFVRNYRGKATKIHDNTGQGLGLAIAKEVIELHNGTIQAKSTDSKTTIKVRLPPINNFTISSS